MYLHCPRSICYFKPLPHGNKLLGTLTILPEPHLPKKQKEVTFQKSLWERALAPRKNCYFVTQRSRVQVVETSSLQSKGKSRYDKCSPDALGEPCWLGRIALSKIIVTSKQGKNNHHHLDEKAQALERLLIHRVHREAMGPFTCIEKRWDHSNAYFQLHKKQQNSRHKSKFKTHISTIENQIKIKIKIKLFVFPSNQSKPRNYMPQWSTN